MTNREHMIGLLQAHTKETFQYFTREFGCGQILLMSALNTTRAMTAGNTGLKVR